MEVKTVAIESLTLDPNNARKHPEKNLEAIKGSLIRFGQQKPIVVDKQGIVIAGNGTLAAARALGWTSIAVVESTLEKWNAMAYALADNRTAELATWDEEVLRDQIKALGDFDFPLPEIGFDKNDFFNVNPDSDGLPDGVSDHSGLGDAAFDHQCPRCKFEFND